MDSDLDEIEFGNFTLETTDTTLQEIMDFRDPEFDLIFGLDTTSASSIGSFNELMRALESSDDPALPPPGNPSTSNRSTAASFAEPNRKRFKSVNEETIKKLEAMNQSESTKKNTRWGMKILQDWHIETYKGPLDMATVQPEELAQKLSKFYCEASPQSADKHKGEELYHKNSLKNIRAAVNRHLSDINREIDIVNDRVFKHANSTLNGLLKERVASGTSRPTQHKDIINKQDLQKISSYLNRAYSNPVTLRLCTWYILSVHFVTRGLEWHHQLTRNSFEFKFDENGIEYACITHETRQKNYQGGLSSDEASADKRMYATQTQSCPVNMLKLLISKTDENASHLFNKIAKDAREYPDSCHIWYSSSPLGKTTFTNFLPDICKEAGCSKRYTAHCLRATTIQAMSDAGVETRQIMFMSGHRNEASVRSYSRECSSSQKRSLSTILSATASGDDVIEKENAVVSVSPATTSVSSSSLFAQETGVTPHLDVSNTLSSIQSGILTNSSFSNCSFTFNMKM